MKGKKRYNIVNAGVICWWLLGLYALQGITMNFKLNLIDYTPSRFVIKKNKTGISEKYNPQTTYAVFVNGFPGSNIKLDLGEKAIAEVANVFKKEGIETNILSYKNCKNGEELKSKLENKLEELSEEISSDDSFIFVYSGHGTKVDGTANLLIDETNFMWENELKLMMENIHSKYKIIIIDSCYSGNLAETLRGKNTITISKSSKDKSAVNFFIGFIPEILSNNKKADKDKNGKISLEESFVYAVKEDWFTNYTNVFLQLPRQCPHMFSEGIDPNEVYLLD